MAVRQKSELTGKPRKPRIQTVVSEELLEKLEADAEKRGISMSRLTEEILRAHYEGRSVRPGPDMDGVDDDGDVGSNPDEIVQMFKMFKKMQEAGLI